MGSDYRRAMEGANYAVRMVQKGIGFVPVGPSTSKLGQTMVWFPIVAGRLALAFENCRVSIDRNACTVRIDGETIHATVEVWGK